MSTTPPKPPRPMPVTPATPPPRSAGSALPPAEPVPTSPTLSIVLPVYNEGEAVEAVLRALAAEVRTRHELVVVYDFDEDTTVPVIARLEDEIPGLRGLRNDFGRGVLNAMKAGVAGTRAPYVLISMADGSDEPAIVDRMVALAQAGADVVAASRYMPGGRQVGGPLLKRTMSRLAGLSLHRFAGVATHDPTSNFKLYSRRFLEAVRIESTAGFELALELTVKATLAGRRVEEVPTTWRDRTSGESNFRLRKWLPHYLHWYRVALVAAFRAWRKERTQRRAAARSAKRAVDQGTGIGPDSKRLAEAFARASADGGGTSASVSCSGDP
jgi:dolichol-phosphate mannosyltransferase